MLRLISGKFLEPDPLLVETGGTAASSSPYAGKQGLWRCRCTCRAWHDMAPHIKVTSHLVLAYCKRSGVHNAGLLLLPESISVKDAKSLYRMGLVCFDF